MLCGCLVISHWSLVGIRFKGDVLNSGKLNFIALFECSMVIGKKPMTSD